LPETIAAALQAMTIERASVIRYLVQFQMGIVSAVRCCVHITEYCCNLHQRKGDSARKGGPHDSNAQLKDIIYCDTMEIWVGDRRVRRS
jgi:hypothetical protein